MRSLVYTAPGRMEMQEWPRRQCGDGEIEIAVAAAGICGADISGFWGRSRRRKAPLIFGHEVVGRRVDGQRVVADPLIGCGRCSECLGGATNLCSGLRLLGMDGVAGCFAEFVIVLETQVYEIPDGLTDAQAVLAEPLANVVHLFRLAGQLDVGPRFRMGIVGAGLMGSMALQMAMRMGADEVLVEDLDEVRLAAAREMGATLAVSPETGEGRRFAGRGLDLVLDACGDGKARQEAFDLCRTGGMVVLLGMANEQSELDFGASIRKEHRVLMSFGYTAEDFGRSLDLLVAGEIDLTGRIEEMPLEQGQRAFERMTESRGSTLKMVLRVA